MYTYYFIDKIHPYDKIQLLILIYVGIVQSDSRIYIVLSIKRRPKNFWGWYIPEYQILYT